MKTILQQPSVTMKLKTAGNDFHRYTYCKKRLGKRATIDAKGFENSRIQMKKLA